MSDSAFHIMGELGALGAFLGGLLALWSAVWGPWAKRRQARADALAEDRKYRRETHQALYGMPARRDDSGALIAKPKPGLIAGLQALSDDVSTLRAEFPVNGIPARAAIDTVNQNLSDLRSDVLAQGRKIDRHIADREAHLR